MFSFLNLWKKPEVKIPNDSANTINDWEIIDNDVTNIGVENKPQITYTGGDIDHKQGVDNVNIEEVDNINKKCDNVNTEEVENINMEFDDVNKKFDNVNTEQVDNVNTQEVDNTNRLEDIHKEEVENINTEKITDAEQVYNKEIVNDNIIMGNIIVTDYIMGDKIEEPYNFFDAIQLLNKS